MLIKILVLFKFVMLNFRNKIGMIVFISMQCLNITILLSYTNLLGYYSNFAKKHNFKINSLEIEENL